MVRKARERHYEAIVGLAATSPAAALPHVHVHNHIVEQAPITVPDPTLQVFQQFRFHNPLSGQLTCYWWLHLSLLSQHVTKIVWRIDPRNLPSFQSASGSNLPQSIKEKIMSGQYIVYGSSLTFEFPVNNNHGKKDVM